MISTKIVLATLSLAVALTVTPAPAQVGTLDQDNPIDAFAPGGIGMNEIRGDRPGIGQSFIPTLPLLTDVVLSFNAQDGAGISADALYTVELFLAGGAPAPDGPSVPLGTATRSGAVVDFGDGLDEVFTFAAPVAVTPGTKYAFTLSFADPTVQGVGTLLLGASGGDPYANGAALFNEVGPWRYLFDDPQFDIAFQTYGTAIPEPAGLSLLALGSLVLAFVARGRRG